MQYRREIDGINDRLLELLEARGRLVVSIAAMKRAHHVEIVDAQREEAMLAAVLARATGLFSQDQLERVFRCIFDMSRDVASRW